MLHGWTNYNFSLMCHLKRRSPPSVPSCSRCNRNKTSKAEWFYQFWTISLPSLCYTITPSLHDVSTLYRGNVCEAHDAVNPFISPLNFYSRLLEVRKRGLCTNIMSFTVYFIRLIRISHYCKVSLHDARYGSLYLKRNESDDLYYRAPLISEYIYVFN